jgi:hypothetical protein
VTLDDLKAWHDRTIRGKLIVSVSGDFDAATMEAKLRAAFESLPTVKAEPARHDIFADPKPGVSFIDKEDINQSNIEIVGLGTDRRNPDVPALSVMNEILGGGFASRLFQKVRTELGLAYAVGGGYGFAYDHPAEFHAIVMTKSVSTVDATKAALAEIAGLTTQPFTNEELARAKDNILNSFLFRYDTREKVLAERVKLEFYGYPADYLETYQAALESNCGRPEPGGEKVHTSGQIGRAHRRQRTGNQTRTGRVEARPGADRGHHHSDAQANGNRRAKEIIWTPRPSGRDATPGRFEKLKRHSEELERGIEFEISCRHHGGGQRDAAQIAAA